jgi:hypothetical protein
VERVAAVEEVLGVIPQVVRVKGFLGMKTTFLNLVVTDQRLLFANQSEAMWDLTDAEEKRLEAAFEQQSQDWRRFVASYDFGTPPWQVYFAMAPDLILAEDRENLAIPISDVEFVQVTLSRDPDLHSSTLMVRTRSEEHEFELPWGNGEQAHHILAQVLPLGRARLVEEAA